MNSYQKPNRTASPYQTYTRKPQPPTPQPVPPAQPQKRNPVREEIEKSCGEFTIVADVREDTETLNSFRHISGMIAFLCTLKRGGKIISQGRGSAVLNKMSRFYERSISTAFNASVLDALVRSYKIDTFHPDSSNFSEQNVYGVYAEKSQDKDPDGITDRQRSYLQDLIFQNVIEENEREQWLSQLEDMGRSEAAKLIKSFVS